MAALQGKAARIRYTAAVATSSTNQACTLSSVDKVTLTVNATGRRRWDPTSTHIHVYGGGSSSTAISSTDYVVDYAVGRIRFSTAHTTAPTKAYTLDIPWLATSYLAYAKAFTVTNSVDMLDVTSFSTGTDGAQFRTYLPGLSNTEVTISRFVPGGTTSETTAPVFVDRALLNLPFYLELIVNSTDQAGYVGYGYVSGIQGSEQVDTIAAEEISFKVSGALNYTT